jgi:hypothetical protein
MALPFTFPRDDGFGGFQDLDGGVAALGEGFRVVESGVLGACAAALGVSLVWLIGRFTHHFFNPATVFSRKPPTRRASNINGMATAVEIPTAGTSISTVSEAGDTGILSKTHRPGRNCGGMRTNS